MIQTGQPTVQYNDFKLSLLRKSGKKISWNRTNYKTAVCKLQYIEVKLLKYMPIIYYNNILYNQSTASIAKITSEGFALFFRDSDTEPVQFARVCWIHHRTWIDR